MSLLQKACETFDCHQVLAGKEVKDHTTLAPISHLLTKAEIEITLDQNGVFVSARAVDRNEPKIIIPVTEESGGRTSSPCAHPLCDQLAYIGTFNEEKHSLYITQLSTWQASPYSHPKLKPILNYAKAGTIIRDLVAVGLIKLDENGLPEKEKLMVRWVIVGLGKNSGPCWTDQSLFQAFENYYYDLKAKKEIAFCQISGEYAPMAMQHPKGIIPINGNAKLVSANDSSGFTYRGRFENDSQAATVSYIASQKAHNALRWIAAEQGIQVVFGGRTFLCWNPKGVKTVHATGPFRNSTKNTVEPSAYREMLKRTLSGYRSELPEENAEVVIAAFDAATTGRLATTYYNELHASDFLQRLHDWDMHCCWWNGQFGIQSPSLYQIVNLAYGTQREENKKIFMRTDDRVLRQQMQRLLSCRVDRARIPLDIVKNLSNRASVPQSYDHSVWQSILFTACAILNQHIYQTKGDDAMAWELDKQERSFQYGRLLAVMERAEADYYYNSQQEGRQTNAMKRMSVFRRRPWAVAEQINAQLVLAYLPRLKPWQADRYSRLRGEIIEIIQSFPEEELDKPLNNLYLMGYERQRSEFFKTSTKETEDENK